MEPKIRASPENQAPGPHGLPGVGDLLDVVDHIKEFPLRADLQRASQRESSHPLVLQIAENRFHGRHSFAVSRSSELTVKLRSHSFARSITRGLRRSRSFAALDDQELPLNRSVGMTKTLTPKRAPSARRDGRLEDSHAVVLNLHVRAAPVHRVTRGAVALLFVFDIGKILQREETLLPLAPVARRLRFLPA